MKKIAFLSIAAALMMACSSNPKTDSSQTQTTEAKAPVEVTVANFEEKAPGLVNQMITIKGTADHICKHDGKKLFLVDTISDGRIKVVTGAEVADYVAAAEAKDGKRVLKVLFKQAVMQKAE